MPRSGKKFVARLSRSVTGVKSSYRRPALRVTRGDTFQSSLTNTPIDFWFMCRSVAPNDRLALSNRASSRPTSASTSLPVLPLAVSVVRAWFRTLRL